MKKTLLSLALTSTLLLGNGCEERKPRQVYTLKDGNAEITLSDYWHEYNLEIKTPESKRRIYAEDCCPTHKDPQVTTVIDYTANSTNKYFRYSENVGKTFVDSQQEFNKYFNKFIQKNNVKVENTQERIESSSLFKQFE